MESGQMGTDRVIAGALWVVVICLVAAAWIVGLWGPWLIAGLLATTGCVMSAVAAVAQIRCYSADLCRLVRVTAGLERPTSGELHEFTGPRR